MARIGINIATGSLQQDEMVVGIDLGTTHSLVAIIHPETGQPLALKEQGRSSLVPSVVYFDPSGQAIVGEAAREKLETEPERTIFSAKRLMGKSYEDLSAHRDFFTYTIMDDGDERLVRVNVSGRYYSPIELSSYILKELKARAEHILKTPVTKAVITVPAYFNDVQRQATRDAGRLAGLDVLRIINEPTAASLAYGFGTTATSDTSEKTIAVYDLGGGTFDVSLLRVSGGVFDVLSTNGDTYLGGDDFDRVIIAHWMPQHGIDSASAAEPHRQAALRMMAERAKKALSTNTQTEEHMGDQRFALSRADFNELIEPLVERTLVSCRQALQDAGITASQVDEVVMVGGSTRVPLVKEKVSAFFGRPLNDRVDPDEVVALGAALQAGILSGKEQRLLLLDITPLSLGIETAGGLMDVLIPRNAKIPSGAARQYTTQVDGQGSMRISIFQGERDLVQDNRKLAEFTLNGIPAMPAGLPKVEIRFLINADGILTVSARELRSGVEQQIQVEPKYGLTDQDVERMLMDSLEHAESDIRQRALAEARSEGEQLLRTTENYLQKNNALLTRQELLDTATAMQNLQLSLTLEDKDLIRRMTEALNEITRPYAERIMNEAVSRAMKGKSV